MPESEPKPKLIELMAPGAGQGWKAVLKNGKPAVVHEIPIPQAEATAAVRVTSNGEVRLAGHPAAAVRGAPSQSDLRADVRSSGMAVCAAFGVDPAGAPAPPNIPPGLVVTMRSMASGAMGPSADRALGALREMAAPLLAPDRQMASQSELATRAGGREVPAITPFLPAGDAPAARQTFAPTPAPAPAPAPPAPFIAPPRREGAQVHGSVYEAPDRPLQTYPSMPAITFPPVAAPLPQAPAASAAVETPPATPVVPTWAEAPPRSAAPFDAATITNPPAPAPPIETPLPEPAPPPPAPTFAPPQPAPTLQP